MTTQQPQKRQNAELSRGINAISANGLARSNGRRAPPKSAAPESKKPAEAAEFSTRKWYPADFIPKKLASAKTARNSKKTARLRKSITPGTVLILLSGRFRGKRVVFLKQLPSGTLLVTGPYKVNGVPLRRVNQAYVIATSTKVDLADVALPEIDDSYFAKDKSGGKRGKEAAFFAQDATEVRPFCFGTRCERWRTRASGDWRVSTASFCRMATLSNILCYFL